jgi:hypothetical protein
VLGHVKNRVTLLTQRHWPQQSRTKQPSAGLTTPKNRRSVRRGSGLLEVIGSSAMFVIAVSLLAAVTTTAITSRVLLTRAASLDSAMNTALQTAASAPWDELVTNTFTPPSPLCAGDVPGSGTLARTCAVVNGRTVEISWRVSAKADATGADGILQGAADSLLLTARAEREDGSIAARSRTVMAPSIGYRVAPGSPTADGVVRVQLAGSWRTLDSPVLLLQADNSTVAAASRVGADGSLVLRAAPDACEAASPCRLALDTGLNRGMTPTHSLDAASLFSETGNVVLSAGRVSYATATVIRRGVLDVYVQALNTTSNRQLAWSLVPGASAVAPVVPYRGSVCLWLSFQDGIASQRVPACNTTHLDQAITFETYEPSPQANPGVRVAVPTDKEIGVVTEGANTTCPVVSGQTYYTMSGGSAVWQQVTTNGVCSSWTWGRPTTLSVEGGATTPFDNARVTIAGGGHTTATASWVDSDRARPAAGAVGVADAVWAKPRAANSCPGWGTTGCAPTWLTNAAAASPESTSCPTSHCSSPAPSAPYLRWVTKAGGTARGWPHAITTTASETVSFSTTFADAEGQSITLTPTSVPSSSYGTLRLCNPTCTNVTASTSVSIASGATASWQWVSSSSSAGGAINLTATDSTGASRVEVVHFPRTGTTPVAARLSRGVAFQNTSDALTAWVTNTDGAAAGASSVSWAACSTNPQALTGSTGATGSASAGWAPVASAAATAQCDAAVTADGQAAQISGAVEQEVRAAPSTVVPSVGASTQGTTTDVTVAVTDAAGDALTGWPVSVAARSSAGTPAQSVWARPSWCRTTSSGSCVVSFSVGTDSDGSWTADARVGNITAQRSSTVTRIASHVTAGSVTITQGKTATLTVAVTDGAQRALAKQNVTITLPPGLTVTQTSTTTGSTGRTEVALSAALTMPAGPARVLIQSGLAVSEITVTVKPAPAVLSVAASYVELQQGERSQLVVSVMSENNEPVPGARVIVTGASGGLSVSPAAVTVENGTAVLALYARKDAKMQGLTLTISSPGTAPLTATVVVK